MSQLFSNYAKTTIAAVVTKDSTTIEVTPTTGGLFSIPTDNQYEKLLITDGELFEILKMTNRVGDTLTVERGEENSLKRLWPQGSVIMSAITKDSMERLYSKEDVFAALNILNYTLFR